MEMCLGSSDRLFVRSRRELMTIKVAGVLDAVVVKAVGAVLAASADHHSSVEIDLDAIVDHTDTGVAALAQLVRSHAAVTYRAASEPAQAALRGLYRDREQAG